jgi:hypothetical protein
MVSIQERANAFLDILDRPIPKILLGCWGVIATWDTFVSQFIPEETAKSFPKAHQVIAMTYGWLSVQTWLLIGAGIVVLASLEYAARHKWKLELATGADAPIYDSSRPLQAIFWVFAVSLVGFVWLLDLRVIPKTAQGTLPTPIPAAPAAQSAAPPPTQPPPKPTPTPAPIPKEQWVSDEEFRAAKKAGKLLIPFSPEELSLMNYNKGKDSTQAYVGQWIKIHNKFDSVQRFVETDKREYLVVRIEELRLAFFVFDNKKWADRILTLRPGAMIDGFCQLTAYDGKPYEIITIKVSGMNCELN